MDDLPPDRSRWWKNRRRMAWVALVAGVGFPFAAGVGWADASVASAFYTFVGFVVVSYIGTALIDDKGWPGGKP